MKKIILSALCLLLASAPSLHADIFKDAILEVLQERLEKTIDKDFKDSGYWQELLGNVANGTPEVTVTQIMNDYTPESITKDTGMKILEKLVPEAAGPIGLLLVANEAVHGYTNYMLDFYKAQHMQEFRAAVIDPSKTTAELKAKYNTFVNDIINGGGVDMNIAYSERKKQEEEFYNAFLQRFAVLAKIERAQAGRKDAERIVVQKLKLMHAEAKSRVEEARDYLMAAGMDVSAASVKAFLFNSSNNNFAASVRTAANNAGQKKEEKKEPPAAKPDTGDLNPRGQARPVENPASPAVTPGLTPNGQPRPEEKPEVAVVTPSQPGSGPIGQSIQLLNAGKNTENQRTVDFSVVYSAYKSCADKLIFGDMAPSTFADAGDNILAGAQQAYLNCVEASKTPGEATECNRANERFAQDISRIKDNLNDLGGKLKGELENYRMQMLSAPKPGDKLAEISAAMAQDLRTAREGDACDFSLSFLRSEDAVKKVDGCKTYLGFLATVINQLELKTREIQDFTKAYEQKLTQDYAAYSDRYARDYNLASYSGVQLDANIMKNLTDGSTRVQASFADKYAPLGEGIINDLRRRLSQLTNKNRTEEEQLNLNIAFLNLIKPSAREVEKTYLITTNSGNTVDLRKFNGGDYYNTHFKSLFQDFFSGALTLLSDKTKGYDPSEYMSYKQGSIRVWDSEKYPFYKSLEGHEAVLKEFTEKITGLKELELERRHKVLTEAIKKAETEAARITTQTMDAAELLRVFTEAKPVRDALAWYIQPVDSYQLYIGNAASLSASLMDATRDAFAREIEKIKAKERNMTAVFNKYKTADDKDAQGAYQRDLMDARTDLNEKKWKCSAQVWQTYREMGDAKSRQMESAMQKASPINSLSLNGRPIRQTASESIEFGDKDLANGEIVIKGGLYPATLGEVSALNLSLNGQGQNIPLTVGETFSYSFKPKAGTRYIIAVTPIMKDGNEAASWPANGDYFTVEFIKGSVEEITAFYEKFRAAYESRNAPQVLSLISEDWSAGDGTALSDLEENLSNNFRLYDEIRYSLSGLKIEIGSGKYQACYDVTIASRIFKRNLKHEEKSKVCEELSGEAGGKLKISKTFSGSYWYIK